MHTHDRQSRFLASGLSLLAGYIDALGFLALGGVFVSFMSGNSTRFSVGFSQAPMTLAALLPLGIIALFLTGVVLGRLIRHYIPRRPCSSILFCMLACLTLGASFYQIGLTVITVPLMAISMGMANNIFMRKGEVSIGVTYMTGTLVKLGQNFASHLLKESRWQWLPYLFLWLGLIFGAVLGAISFQYFDLAGLWFAAAFCGALTIPARKLDTAAN